MNHFARPVRFFTMAIALLFSLVCANVSQAQPNDGRGTVGVDRAKLARLAFERDLLQRGPRGERGPARLCAVCLLGRLPWARLEAQTRHDGRADRGHRRRDCVRRDLKE